MAADKGDDLVVVGASQSEIPPRGISFGTMVIVGAASVAGAHWIGLFTPDRYPLRTEYEIVKTCVDAGGTPLLRQSYLDKLERCQCSLEATMKKVSYEKFEAKKNEFTSTFQALIEACRKKGRS